MNVKRINVNDETRFYNLATDANDITYNDSSVYDEGTVGGKLSELEQEVGDFPEGLSASSEIDAIKLQLPQKADLHSVSKMRQDIDLFEASVRKQIESYQPIVINGNVTNSADEEDITSSSGFLKLKNRNSLNGRAYVILRNEDVVEQVENAISGTIFEVRYEHNLNGATLTVPSGCDFVFVGGKFTGGTIVFNNTYISAGDAFVLSVKVSGTLRNNEVLADWFINPQWAVNIMASSGGCVVFSAKIYNLDDTLYLKPNVSIKGSGNEAGLNNSIGTIIKYSGDAEVINISGVSGNYAKNISITNIKVRGNGVGQNYGTNIGIKIGQRAHYCLFNNVSVYGCSDGINMDYAWNLDFKSVCAYYCQSGFKLENTGAIPLTSTTFTSCNAYTSNVGFNFLGGMNACSIIASGTD